jgi:hypothetical protein
MFISTNLMVLGKIKSNLAMSDLVKIDKMGSNLISSLSQEIGAYPIKFRIQKK